MKNHKIRFCAQQNRLESTPAFGNYKIVSFFHYSIKRMIDEIVYNQRSGQKKVWIIYFFRSGDQFFSRDCCCRYFLLLLFAFMLYSAVLWSLKFLELIHLFIAYLFTACNVSSEWWKKLQQQKHKTTPNSCRIWTLRYPGVHKHSRYQKV